MKNTLKTFFDYLKNENFEEGFTFFSSSEKPLDIFCAKFLMAKHIVEISYSYAQARELYEDAAKVIDGLHLEFFTPLSEYAHLQATILKIDRGIYTGYATLMGVASKELYTKTKSILKSLENLNNNTDPCCKIIQANLSDKIIEDNIYAQAIDVVAQLYLKRWDVVEDFDKKLSFVQQSVAKLQKMGNSRLASDLAPHTHVLKRFSQRKENRGKLYIKDAEVTFYYYATIDYRLREEFNEILSKISTDECELSLRLQELLHSVIMVPQKMSDIWSGLASIEFIDTYSFRLDRLKINNFRKLKNIEAEVELRYYTMGVFELKINFLIDNEYLKYDPKGLSISGLRHLESLSTPFALDEDIEVQELDEKHRYLSDYADVRFEKLNENIFKLLQDCEDLKLLGDSKLILHNSEQNRFSLVRINDVAEDCKGGEKNLFADEFKSHFEYHALVMPLREVRSAIDNWIMYDNSLVDKNLAGIRYNESEWLSINTYQGLIALLEQPVWVFDQGVESMEVASAVLNLLKLSNIQAQTELKNIDKDIKNIINNKKSLENKIVQLDEFRTHISNLLQTVEAGAMMTYPDHTLFMDEVFKSISLDKHMKKALLLQKELKDKRANSMEIITKLNEKTYLGEQKIIKLVVSIASVFMALGAFNDIFELWSSSKTIQTLNLDGQDGDFKLFFVLILAVVSTIWLVYDNYKKDGKE